MGASIARWTGVRREGSSELVAEAGITKIGRGNLGRRLLLEKDGVRVVLVRPADVAAYVDFGAVDLGVVGKDQLWENPGTHYELVDLGFGACTLVMAVPEGSALNGPEGWPPVLRIATKYPRATAALSAASGRRAGRAGRRKGAGNSGATRVSGRASARVPAGIPANFSGCSVT